MAFPIPAHLPRRAAPQDVSSQILSKIDAATSKTLDAALATSWVSELEQNITSTKLSIHERIQKDLPEFKRQLTASKSVQERLQTLTINVDALHNSVSDPDLKQITDRAGTNTSLNSLESLINSGKLSEAVEACTEMQGLLEASPPYLNETRIMMDMRRKFNAAQARNDEQLSDAYSRSVSISRHGINSSHAELILHSSVQVRQSDANIQFPAVLASLSPNSLSNHLTTLRRDLTTQFIDTMAEQTLTIAVSSGTSTSKFSLTSAASDERNLTTRLHNLANFFEFLSSHLFSNLPASHATSFARSLCKPTITSILNNLLLPSLPSSFDNLPPFLEFAQEVVSFEERTLIGLLRSGSGDRPLKSWLDGVSGHYERQRRTDILKRSRDIIVAWADSSETFLVEVDVLPIITPSVVPIQDDQISPAPDDIAWGFDDTDSKPDVAEEQEAHPVKDDAWGFDDDEPSAGADDVVDENGWGFDDDIPAEPEEAPAPLDVTAEEHLPSESEVTDINESEPDPSEAWGWNEDEDAPPTDETAWDDPWSEGPPDSALDSSTESHPSPAPSTTSAKAATRLEKAANKVKKRQQDGDPSTSTPVSSPPVSISISPSLDELSLKSPSQRQNGIAQPMSATKRPPVLNAQSVPKESYVASNNSKSIVRFVEDVLAEGKHLADSSIFSAFPAPSSTPLGTTLLLTAPAVLDLHRAIYPVKFSASLQGADIGMRYSNDCAFLAEEVDRMRRGAASFIDERLEECAKCLRVLSESWYQDIIVKEQKSLDKILKTGSQGFAYTGDQSRYDECESAVTQALKEVRRVASQLKGILTKSKYYTAIGMLVEAALARILSDILALPDIPEVESHRLSELCHIFNALEGLFVEDAAQPSFVVAYVPSWLKFSYLSELLEASMADITYLFEEGALVDFQVDELVRLVRALFADTQLRTNTITKIMGGHSTLRP
ncbi:hypothetical protein H0H92_006788 [Tricholoma furcatifolium]|nr:hypothetical protein H0H92_006788 [Tricholoma furcatifolium]